MSLFGKIFETAGDLISLPFDVVKDVSSAVHGEEITATKDRISGLAKDVKEAVDDTLDGDFI